jgi:hypothetical protein
VPGCHHVPTCMTLRSVVGPSLFIERPFRAKPAAISEDASAGCAATLMWLLGAVIVRADAR